MIPRYLTSIVRHDLAEKMVFIGGPRQVGKTTFAKALEESMNIGYQYLNWDDRRDRKKIMNYQFDPEAKCLIFDEIHKWKAWKNYLKGVFDTEKEKVRILVTGSARLDLYRRGGESLMGRYHYHLLHPLSVAEVMGKEIPRSPQQKLSFDRSPSTRKVFERLFKYGGFPEPFIKQDDIALKRWHQERIDRLMKDDIREVEFIRNLTQLEILADILPERAGSLLSLNNLRQDLEVSHKTISLWMDILERFYYHYRISPYQGKRIRSLKKEQKLYLWDWSEIADEGKRFENMIGSHLLKYCHFLEQTFGEKIQLHYLRDKDGREVDFLIVRDKKPWFAVEVRSQSKELSKHLTYFAERLDIKSLYQVVLEPNVDCIQKGVRTMSAEKFLRALV